MENSFEKPPQEQKDKGREALERFGDSLMVFGETELVREHLKDLERLPAQLVQVMRKKGLKVAIGEGNIIDLMSKVPGIKAFIVRSAERFMAREVEVEINIGRWQRVEKQRPPMPMGVYAAILKTAFVVKTIGRGHGTISSSAVLHEYGHGLGHLLKLDGDETLKEAHLRLYPRLNSYLQQDKAGSFAGRKELLAESFAGYITLPKEQFISIYDEQMYSFWEQTIATVEEGHERN